MTKVECLVGLVVELAAVARGMLYSPLDGLRFSLIMIYTFLNMFTLFLETNTTHSSSYSWPTEIRGPGLRLL